jgi:peptidoglycan/xylan/chitin deacetylase (PgdA/CDA1 family)
VRAVLTYHSIDETGSPVSVSEGAFRAHVSWLASGAVRVVPLRDLLALDADGPDAIALTFDDALESFGTLAAPLLLEAGLPVTVFVVSDYVGRTSDWSGTGGSVPVFPVLPWSELGRLAAAGVELGAHTRTHPILTQLSDERLAAEIEGSGRCVREETGVEPRAFSYPYGACDDRVVAATIASGYAAAVTTELMLLGRVVDPHRVPRLDMYYFRDPRRLEAWGTPTFRAYTAARHLGRRVREAAVRRRP